MRWGSFAGGIAQGGLAGFQTGYNAQQGIARDRRAQESHDLDMKVKRTALEDVERNRAFQDDLKAALNQAITPQLPAGDPSAAAGIAGGAPMEAPKDTRAPEERMLAAAEATYMTAAKHGKADVLKASMGDALQMRDALMKRAVDAGLKNYRLTGDPTGLFEAYNKYFPDGQNAKFVGQDDQGNIRFQTSGKDGKATEGVLPKAKIESTIRWMTSPQEMLKAQIEMATAAYKEGLKVTNVPQGGVAVRGDGTVLATNPAADQFHFGTTKDEEGNETPYVGNKKTGVVTQPGIAGAGGEPAPAPQPGTNMNTRKNLPVFNQIGEISLQRKGQVDNSGLTTKWLPTQESAKLAEVSQRLYQANPKLSPETVVTIAEKGTHGTAVVRTDDGKVMRVPAVVHQGETYLLGGIKADEVKNPTQGRAYMNRDQRGAMDRADAGVGARAREGLVEEGGKYWYPGTQPSARRGIEP